MGQAARKDSSMEDILSSIRKIISGDANASDTQDVPSSAPLASTDNISTNGIGAIAVENPTPAIDNSQPSVATQPNSLNPTKLPNSASMGFGTNTTDTPTQEIKTDAKPAFTLSQLADQIKAGDAAAPAVVVNPTAAPRAPEFQPQNQPSVEQPASASNDFAEFANALREEKKQEEQSKIPDNKANPVVETAKIANTSAPVEPSTFSQTIRQAKENFSSSEVATDVPVAQPVAQKVAQPVSPIAVEPVAVEPVAVVEKPVQKSSETAPEKRQDTVEVAEKSEAIIKSEAIPVEEKSASLKPAPKVYNDAELNEPLISSAAQSQVAGSIERLKRSVESIEHAQIEMALRPMLRKWLDHNLPQIVEDMVQEEIERISGKADKT